jgi:hypothetical protein
MQPGISKKGFRHSAADVRTGFAAFLESNRIIREANGTVTLCLGFNISTWRKKDLREWFLGRVTIQEV